MAGASCSPSRSPSIGDSGTQLETLTLVDPAVLVSNLTKEVRLLMRLDHPNVIKMYQVFDTTDELCIVMEYAKGELIDYIAATGSLSEREARKYFRQVHEACTHRVDHVNLRCLVNLCFATLPCSWCSSS